MLEIKCSRLGYDCAWTYRDNAEYMLLDITGMHLRECHHVTEIDLDLLGKIRTSFTYPSAGDAAKKADAIMEHYNCEGDPQCSLRYQDAVKDFLGPTIRGQKKAA